MEGSGLDHRAVGVRLCRNKRLLIQPPEVLDSMCVLDSHELSDVELGERHLVERSSEVSAGDLLPPGALGGEDPSAPMSKPAKGREVACLLHRDLRRGAAGGERFEPGRQDPADERARFLEGHWPGRWFDVRSRVTGFGPGGVRMIRGPRESRGFVSTRPSARDDGANAMLKGGFVNIGHKFFRVFGLTKMTLLLAFTLVGYNLDRIRSFLAKRAQEKARKGKPRRRAKRKSGTWTDIESRRSLVGRDPPPD